MSKKNVVKSVKEKEVKVPAIPANPEQNLKNEKEKMIVKKPENEKKIDKGHNHKTRAKKDKKPKRKKIVIPPQNVEKETFDRLENIFGRNIPKPTDLPQMKPDKPYVMVTGVNQQFMTVNCALVGSLAPKGEENIISRVLRLSKCAGYPELILTGNLMYMLTQKFGTNRSDKTMVSDNDDGITPEEIEDSYPPAVTEDGHGFEHIKDRLLTGRAIYDTFWHKLERNLKKLSKMFRDKNHKLLYDGYVLIIFGKYEEDLIRFFANELQRVDLFKTKAWARKRIRELKAELRDLESGDKIGQNIIFGKIKDFQKFIDLFVSMGNNLDGQVNKVNMIATGYLVEMYEKYIPNSKVISLSNSYLKTGNKNVMATTVKGKSDRPNGQADILESATRGFAKGRDASSVPDLTLGYGMNSKTRIKVMTYQASKVEGEKKQCFIFQLPTSVDSGFYREVVQNHNYSGKDPITKLACVSGFQSGVAAVGWYSGIEEPVIDSWTSHVLTDKDNFKDKKSIRDLVEGRKKEHRLVYYDKDGCCHWGTSEKLMFKSPNDPNGRLIKSPHQVRMEMFLAIGAPICGFLDDGDSVQSFNMPYSKDQHPLLLSQEELREAMMVIEKSGLPTEKIIKNIQALALNQNILSGIYDFEKQITGYVESLVPYLEYFVNILERNKRFGISYKGRFAPILFLLGNHIRQTWKRLGFSVPDASWIVDKLIIQLMKYLEKTGRVELTKLLDDGIKAPRWGVVGEARGMLCFDGKDTYAGVGKHTQGRMANTLRRAHQRNTEPEEYGEPILNFSGDNHRLDVCIEDRQIHVKTGGQMGDGGYGHLNDLPEQDVDSVVLGVPFGGLNKGPIRIIFMGYETLRKYAEKPFPVDAKKLFKNAVE